jgi:Ala-tRNA(Pro) deacylase
MVTAQWIKTMLEQRGVVYQALSPRGDVTAEEADPSEPVSGQRLVRVAVALVDVRPVELILPASRRVVLNRVGKLLGADDVRLACEAELGRIFLVCETGALAPLQLWKDVVVLMDASLSSAGNLVIPAGTDEQAIRLDFQDWFSRVNPGVGFFTEPDHGAS